MFRSQFDTSHVERRKNVEECAFGLIKPKLSFQANIQNALCGRKPTLHNNMKTQFAWGNMEGAASYCGNDFHQLGNRSLSKGMS